MERLVQVNREQLAAELRVEMERALAKVMDAVNAAKDGRLIEDSELPVFHLMKELETKSGGIYKASAGAIYPALQQIEDEGLVTSDTAAGKRTYSLTEAGKAELQREAETVKKIWRRAEQAGDWAPWMGMEGAEVMRPAAEVMKAALKTATRGSHDSAKIAKIREILERAKHEIEGLEKPA